MTAYQDRVREHSFDGIQEFDNRLPNWWLWSFYLACIFSVLYWVHYHVLGTGDLPVEAWKIEEQEAGARIAAQMAKDPVTAELLQKMAGEPAVVAQGEAVFRQHCALCHKEDGSGNIGPNLTDGYWIYGGKPMDLFETVMHGRPNGMQAWNVYGRQFVTDVVAYVMAEVKGTDRPGKEPQGEKEAVGAR